MKVLLRLDRDNLRPSRRSENTGSLGLPRLRAVRRGPCRSVAGVLWGHNVVPPRDEVETVPPVRRSHDQGTLKGSDGAHVPLDGDCCLSHVHPKRRYEMRQVNQFAAHWPCVSRPQNVPHGISRGHTLHKQLGNSRTCSSLRGVQIRVSRFFAPWYVRPQLPRPVKRFHRIISHLISCPVSGSVIYYKETNLAS